MKPSGNFCWAGQGLIHLVPKLVWHSSDSVQLKLPVPRHPFFLSLVNWWAWKWKFPWHSTSSAWSQLCCNGTLMQHSWMWGRPLKEELWQPGLVSWGAQSCLGLGVEVQQSLELLREGPAEVWYCLFNQHKKAKVTPGQVSVLAGLPKLSSCCCSTPGEDRFPFGLHFYRTFYKGFQTVSSLRRCPLCSLRWVTSLQGSSDLLGCWGASRNLCLYIKYWIISLVNELDLKAMVWV